MGETYHIHEIADHINPLRAQTPAEQALLAGISGIDASGKGYITGQLAEILRPKLNVAVLNVDGWLNLPHVRFSDLGPGEHFYRNALRLDEMFEHLVLPLKRHRRIDLTFDHTDETATEYRLQHIAIRDIDIILLEGIFLFQPKFLPSFDLTIWIECSFETALERAVVRSQEGLGREETIRAYETIYFPAQRLHFAIDQPANVADLLLANDR
jgi:uridine kinase